jgi:ABC-type multidrug transport system ATPase subunit
MKQRFGIAQALLANPKLIIVDEPTAGLDPAERNRFLNLLSSLASNTIVILSTHIVEDVRELCPRMAIISNGQVVLEGAPEETLDKLKGGIYSIVVKSEEEFKAVSTNFKLVSTKLLGGAHELRIHSDTDPGEGFKQVEPNLEDVYFMTLNSQRVN